MTLTLSRKAIMLVSIPLAFEIVFVASLGLLLHQVDGERAREAHARNVAVHMNALLRVLLERGSSLVFAYLSHNQAFHKKFEEGRVKAQEEEASLRLLVRDYPDERQAIDRLSQTNEACQQHMNAAFVAMKEGDVQTVRNEWVQVEKLREALVDASEHIVREQEGIELGRRQKQAEYRARLEVLLYAGVLFNVVLAFCLALYFNRGTARRFEVLVDNAMRLAAGKSLNAPLAGDDEIANLDRNFRRMSSALVAAMQKERAIVENAAELICTIDQEGIVEAINPACEEILGRSQEELTGSHVAGVIAGEEKEQTLAWIRNTAREAGRNHRETRLLKRNGEPVDVSWSAQWAEDEQALICVIHDISARKQVERLKRDFVAMVSHDLRTPLTSIKMVLSLLQEQVYGQVSEAGLLRLGETQDNIDRLMDLVNGLLVLDKMESGQFEVSLAPLTIDQVVKASLQAVAGLAQKRKVLLEVEPVKSFPLSGDRDRLVQVLVNLLANAIKFSPEKSRVIVSVESQEKEIIVTVKDQGRGVPREMQAAIFDRFKQVEGGDERQKGGTGLGLAICKVIIERHGGSIGVTSDGARGSNFWFRLPLAGDLGQI